MSKKEKYSRRKYKKLIKKMRNIENWKKNKIPTPIFIANAPEDFTLIFREGDFKNSPLPDLTEEEKLAIDKFIEKIKKISN